ncbi:hypothetical protein EVAR_38016_1 [Eumeta japonica]|uniref:Uncharacterized protein n=1 Tax=Eumeta variegata TaxID=151549 RepID=A0A4C1WYL0_EUMVA|nr:hypothetical protein EVAR_38016_1 [Eumeta japonica]
MLFFQIVITALLRHSSPQPFHLRPRSGSVGGRTRATTDVACAITTSATVKNSLNSSVITTKAGTSRSVRHAFNHSAGAARQRDSSTPERRPILKRKRNRSKSPSARFFRLIVLAPYASPADRS